MVGGSTTNPSRLIAFIASFGFRVAVSQERKASELEVFVVDFDSQASLVWCWSLMSCALK